jgi:hypothetical protein
MAWEEIRPGPAMKLVGPLAARYRDFGLLLHLRLSATAARMRSFKDRLVDVVAGLTPAVSAPPLSFMAESRPR